jgi:hypothetical protein
MALPNDDVSKDAEVEMVRVGKNHYMSQEEADQKGYIPRLEAPVKGEPFLSPHGISNFVQVVLTITLTYYFSKFLRFFLFGH